MKKILVMLVEDNPAEIELTREIFSSAYPQYQLTVASDGEEATTMLAAALENPRTLPDIILMDLNLPRKDGRQVLAEIKSDPDLRRIPVIVMSSSSAEEDVNYVYRECGNCFVKKPLQLQDFFDIIDAVHHFWVEVATLPRKF
ncbi:Two-component system response regulator [Planctomycetales bacterium 10988]|nr:Two-component system response regulator [Planctomycetales bacterium 10988]